jgi:hypothetical protein
MSLTSGIMPKCYKSATIIPISKPNSPEFRPISLLPHLSKVLEKVILRHWLRPHVSPRIHPDQFAFTSLPGLGCPNALTTIYDALLRYTDSPGDSARLLAIDFVKAFDRAAHQHIMASLVELQVSQECYHWIRSFLSDRTQRVKLHNTFSSWLPVRSGVPQGSVLGPFLFAVLINSFTPCSERTTCVKYADDVTLIHHIPRGDSDQLDVEWNSALLWAKQHDLEVNTSKTKVMTVSFSKTRAAVSDLFGINGIQVEEVKSLRLLGLQVTDNLTWNKEVDKRTASGYRNMHILRQLKHAGVAPKHLWNVYNAITRTLLTYAAPATTNMPAKLIDRLVRVEKRAAKIIGTAPPVPLCAFMHQVRLKILSGVKKLPSHPLRKLFCVRVEQTRMTRCTSLLSAPFARSSRYQKSFTKFAIYS